MTEARTATSAREEHPPQATLLLVDDVPDNLFALDAALSPLGHRTVLARSGEEALRHLLKDEDFATIILDVQMPGLDGFETAAEIRRRERTSDVPILFLTAINRDEVHLLKGFEAGGVDYIFKPVDPELLRAKVSVFVRIYMADRRLRRQAAELRRQAAELARSNADLDQFASVVSHDLVEPLNVITGHLELLVDHLGGNLDPPAQRWVERINSCATRMSALVDDLLSYARTSSLEERSGSPASTSTALGDPLADALENLHSSIVACGARIEVRSPLGVVVGTRRELTQVFQNLVGNSIRHRGDLPPTVVIEAVEAVEAVEDLVTVRIADDGPGVSPAQMERIFGIFERSGDQPAPSSGLGLAICRKIVTRLGGRIWMEANPDRGVSVLFSLRRAGTAEFE
jgi:two-component system, sensor histidine kinase and response regulator